MFNRSSIACQLSIEDLIDRSTTGSTGFYLITIPHLMSWKEVGIRHGRMIKLMRNDAYRKALPKFAGVRVFEEGEKTGRPHAHWVMTPRLSQAKVQHYANLAGMGHVWLDVRPASKFLGIYLGKYLSKGKALRGVRRWSCFGWFDSHKVRDMELHSDAIDFFREQMMLAKAKGLEGKEAYTFAVRAANLKKYGLANYLTVEQPIDDNEPIHKTDLADNELTESGIV